MRNSKTQDLHKCISKWLILIITFTVLGLVTARVTLAQSATPTPSAQNNPLAGLNDNPPQQNRSFAENIRLLHSYSFSFLKQMIEVVEKPSYTSFEFLAKILAGLVLLFSFLRLIRENDGASKELYYWGARAAMCLAFLTMGPYLVNTLGSIGISVSKPTQTIKLDTEKTFNQDYERYVVGNFMIDPAQVQELMPERGPVGVLKKGAGIKMSDLEKDIDMSQWDLPYLFMGLNISRGILAFADLFMLLLTAFVAIALRLAAPFVIAVAIDQKLAQRITYPFIWSTVVLTIITPIVVSLIGILVYGGADIAVLAGGRAPAQVDPQTFNLLKYTTDASQYTIILAIATMLIGALSMFSSPYIAYKTSTGQVFEAVSAQAATWMAALVGSGVEFMGLRSGAALQRQAEVTRAEGARESERVRASTDYNTGLLSVQARQIQGTSAAHGAQTSGLGQISGALTNQLMLQQALNKNVKANLENQFTLESKDINTRRGLAVADTQATQRRDLRNINAGTEGDFLALDGRVKTEMGGRLQAQGGARPTAGGVRAGAGSAVTAVASGGATAYGYYEQFEAINKRAGGNADATNSYASNVQDNQTNAATNLTLNRMQYRDNQTEAAESLLQGSNAAARAGAGRTSAGVREGTSTTIQGINEGAVLEREGLRTQLTGRNQAADIGLNANREAARLNELSAIITGVARDMDRRIEEGMRASIRY
jgi:hypothetical protein